MRLLTSAISGTTLGGDFIPSYRSSNGEPVDPKILIDNKDKSTIAESDIDKVVRDARERSIPVAALVAQPTGSHQRSRRP